MLTVLPIVLCALQSPDWDVKPRAQKLAQELTSVQTMVEQIRVDRWQGPDAGRFENRKQSALNGVRAVRESALALVAAPERLGGTVEVLSRLDSLLLDLSALSYGMARYSNAASADVVFAAVERFSAQREAMRDHAVNLAGARDSEFDVAMKEAQRCREQLVRPQPPRKSEKQ